MQTSRKSYTELLDQVVTMDLGANLSFASGFALQTLDTWTGFTNKPESDFHFGGLDKEMYFEVQDLDAFMPTLRAWPGIELMNDLGEAPWGQRSVRFFDPDHHVIEVGEDMKVAINRMLKSGMSFEQIIERT